MKPTIILLFVLGSSITSLAFAQNRALSLDGNISYIEVPSSPSLDISTELTIELWFTNDILEDNFLLMKNNGVSYPYGLYITGNSSSAGFYLSLKESGVKQIRRDGNFADGKWHHLAGTFDGQIITLYIDGVKRASLPLEKNDEIITKSCPLQIGMLHSFCCFDNHSEMSCCFDKPFRKFLSKQQKESYVETTRHSGFIDEVRLWQIACTQEQIQTTMNITLTGKEEGLVGYWNFDDGAAKDLSPNGNDATLYNNARILEYPRAGQDNTPPTVIKTIPSSSENVPIDIKEIKFFFSKKMNKGWAVDYLDNLPLGAIVWDDDMKILTLNLEQPLQPGAIYFVILNPTFAPEYIDLTSELPFFSDTEGNLLGEVFFTFTTEKKGEVDITPPTITEVAFFKTNEAGAQEKVLSGLSKEVPTDVTDIKIIFSEKMRERGNLSIKYSDNFPKRNAKWNMGGENSMTSVTIHLNEPLMPESKYYIKLNVVDKKYADLAENLLKPYTITFVTVGGSLFVPKKGCIPTTWGAVRKK